MSPRATHPRTPTRTEVATQRAARLPKGKPPEWDGQPVSTFPGREIKPTAGQLSITDPERPLSSSPRNRGKERA